MIGKQTMLAILFVASLLLLSTNATTVTLTGECTKILVNSSSSYLTLNINNTGDGAASSMILEPIIIGGLVSRNATESIPLVAPGTDYSVNFTLANLTTPGSYTINFLATYAQGSSTFSTFFPCIVYVDSPSASLLSVQMIQKGGRLTSNVSSLSDAPINAQLVVMAPPGFGVDNATRYLTVPAGAQAQQTFGFSTPNFTGATLPVVSVVSYLSDDVHYSRFSTLLITLGGQSSAGSSLNLANIAFVAAVAIIIILICASLIVKRRKRRAPPAQVLQ